MNTNYDPNYQLGRYKTPYVVNQRSTTIRTGGGLINEHKRPRTITLGTRHRTLHTTPYRCFNRVEG